MGAYDDAQVCELTGVFLLEKNSEIYNKSKLDYIEMTVYQF